LAFRLALPTLSSFLMLYLLLTKSVLLV
jgi:hypothetical protein